MADKRELFISRTIQKEEFGGKKAVQRTGLAAYQRLPLYSCALSLQPIQGEPMCAPDGTVFDILNIVPYLQHNQMHPVTGKPLKMRDLFKLKFHKNSNGKFHCPITFKVFTDHTHIVAIRTSGNVYSIEAVENLCIKLNNWKDLLDDQISFTKDDIITIQDPHDLSRNVNDFYHINHRNKSMTNDDQHETISKSLTSVHKILEKSKSTTNSLIPPAPNTTTRTSDHKMTNQVVGDDILYSSKPSSSSSSGTASTSFTSTAMNVVYNSDNVQEQEKRKEKSKKREQYDRIKKQKKQKKKAYVTLHTSMGDLNIELYPYYVPQTCDNFLGLCEKGYYNGLKFHRLVPGFMIQGGDPTGTGKGGESLWGDDFADEFHSLLKHDEPGILSMANRGKNTNSSQFFITFKPCPHLDNKHTVFGKVVGGLHILSEMEQVGVDAKERPLTTITIDSAQVFNNPFKEDEQVQEEKRKEQELNKNAEMGQWFSDPTPKDLKPVRQSDTVGKYLPDAAFSTSLKRKIEDSNNNKNNNKKQKTMAGQFNFDNW